MNILNDKDKYGNDVSACRIATTGDRMCVGILPTFPLVSVEWTKGNLKKTFTPVFKTDDCFR